MSRPKSLTFITGNAHKLAEVRAILLGGHAAQAETGVRVGVGVERELELRSRSVEDLPEIQGTVEEIAREKCWRAAEVVSYIT